MAKRLKTISDCRRFMSRIINDLEMGKIEPTIAGKLMFGLNIMGRLLDLGFQQNTVLRLQERIEELENTLGMS